MDLNYHPNCPPNNFNPFHINDIILLFLKKIKNTK
jgi:hypothetical protein